jgi:hypothetical protein
MVLPRRPEVKRCHRPAWLDNAHKALDEAVAAAYGWPADLSEDETLARLLALDQERATQGRQAIAQGRAGGRKRNAKRACTSIEFEAPSTSWEGKGRGSR